MSETLTKALDKAAVAFEVDPSTIQPGDTVFVRGTVRRFASKTALTVEFSTGDGMSARAVIGMDAIVAVEAKPLGVGDRVVSDQDQHGELLGVKGEEAWVQWDAGKSTVVQLSTLRREEK